MKKAMINNISLEKIQETLNQIILSQIRQQGGKLGRPFVPIFKRKDTGNYEGRFPFLGLKRPLRRSLGTKDFQEAQLKYYQLYLEIKAEFEQKQQEKPVEINPYNSDNVLLSQALQYMKENKWKTITEKSRKTQIAGIESIIKVIGDKP